jgi:hypothetical protein
MLAVLLSVALLQQQPERVTRDSRVESRIAFDSTRDAIVTMGARVASVRSSLDLYRRAVFNGSDGDVVAMATHFRRACHALESTARLTARRVCRTCGSRPVQRALEDYRGVMPEVSRTGARCAARLGALLRRKAPEGARLLRRDVRLIGNDVVIGLRSYEQRLAVLREAAGWTHSPPVPRTPPPREGSP